MDLQWLPLAGLLLFWSFLSLSSHALMPAAAHSTSLSNSLSTTTKPDNPEFQGLWALRLSGSHAQDEFNQRTLSIFSLDLTLNYNLAPWLNLNLSPSLRGSSGHTQTETDAGANHNSVAIRNASADFLFLKFGQISAGALSQPEVHTSLLMDEYAFPGLRLLVRAERTESFQWGFFAQSTVPTSSSLTTNTKEFEATPSFVSGGLKLGYQGHSVRWINNFNAFQFQNLPTSVATESGLLGNTVVTSTTADANYVYGYQGLEAKTDLSFDLTPALRANLSAAGVKNNSAPQGLNQGYLLSSGVDYSLSSKVVISPIYQFFRTEPDAVVAYYTDSTLNTNRVGYRVILKGTFSRRFSLCIGGGERDVIFESPAQTRERFYTLGLETLNAKF